MQLRFVRGTEPDSVTTVAVVNRGRPLTTGRVYAVPDEHAAALLETGDWLAVESAAEETNNAE